MCVQMEKKYWHKSFPLWFQFAPLSPHHCCPLPTFVKISWKCTASRDYNKGQSWHRGYNLCVADKMNCVSLELIFQNGPLSERLKRPSESMISSEEHSGYTDSISYLLQSVFISLLLLSWWWRMKSFHPNAKEASFWTIILLWIWVIGSHLCSAGPQRPLIYFSMPAHPLHTSSRQHLRALWFTDGTFPSIQTIVAVPKVSVWAGRTDTDSIPIFKCNASSTWKVKHPLVLCLQSNQQGDHKRITAWIHFYTDVPEACFVWCPL